MEKTRQMKIRRRKGGGGLFSLALNLAGGWIFYSTFLIDHQVPLPLAIDADRQEYDNPNGGKVSYYAETAKKGKPLVLVHSINAAASAFEMKPLFDYYRGKRPVYALDLPGFGFSDRSKRMYSPTFYEDTILNFLNSRVGAPADVVSLSLGSEFVARGAVAYPDLFRSIAMISPSGFSQRSTSSRSQKARSSGISDSVHAVFSFPMWGRPIFDLIATQRSIEYFLKRSFVGPVPKELIDYCYATAHRPGAENAPLHFISGRLFTFEVCDRVYSRVNVPSFVIYDRDSFTRFDLLPDLLKKNTNFRAEKLTPSLGLPQFEMLPETVKVLEEFWKSL